MRPDVVDDCDGEPAMELGVDQAPGSDFRVSTSYRDGVTAIVKVSGDIDVCSSTSLRERLNQVLGDEIETLIVDVAQVPFMDSSGLRCLVGAARRAAATERRLLLVVTKKHVRRVMHMIGIDRVIHVCDSLDEALALGGG